MTNRHPFLALWATVLLLLGLAGPAVAQYGSNDGQYQILHARWGTESHNVDVTERLRELARQDRRFRVVNDTFGTDPHPNHPKTLRIFARGRDGQTRTFDYAEDGQVDGTRFTGWSGGNWGQQGWSGGWQGSGGGDGRDDGEYQILSARYGTATHNIDVTQRLKELARQDRRFRMGNDTFGTDPHPNHPKTLRIYARARDGQTRTFEYAEESLVDGERFTGWGGGNWGQSGWGGGWQGDGGGRGDGGEYQILHARYGTADSNIDVTARLRELARQDRRFRMGNDTFGTDPAPNRRKTLRIYTRAGDGQRRTFEYAEDSVVDGQLFIAWGSGSWGGGGWSGGWGDDRLAGNDREGYGGYAGRGQLTVVHASYGSGEQQRDVTWRLRQQVRDDRIDVQVSNDLAGGDPAPNAHKTLWLTYQLGNGREQRVAVPENARLRLP